MNQPRNIAEHINKIDHSEFVLTHSVVCKYVGKTWEACQESFVSFLPVLMCLLDVTSSNAQHWILCWLLRYYGNEPQWGQIINEIFFPKIISFKSVISLSLHSMATANLKKISINWNPTFQTFFFGVNFQKFSDRSEIKKTE